MCIYIYIYFACDRELCDSNYEKIWEVENCFFIISEFTAAWTINILWVNRYNLPFSYVINIRLPAFAYPSREDTLSPYTVQAIVGFFFFHI